MSRERFVRLFFALEPSAENKSLIADWRERAWPPMARAVPAANFHITLVFLGEVAEHKLEQLGDSVESISAAPFISYFTQVGFWPKPGILWLGSVDDAGPLQSLAVALRRAANSAGLRSDTRGYIPHLTLQRAVRDAPPAPIVAPDFTLHFDRFTLFESQQTRTGVRYVERAEWPLRGFA